MENTKERRIINIVTAIILFIIFNYTVGKLFNFPDIIEYGIIITSIYFLLSVIFRQ